jgi:hypothetical protein
MTDNTALSFTATLLVNGHALCVMADAVDRAVAVAHPDPLLGTIDITQALVALSGPDEAWDQARDAGRVDFHLTENRSPSLFYFRHTDQGYRLYLRSGCCEGQAVFISKYGIPMAQPVENSEPSAWQLRHAHSQQPTLLSELTTDFVMISLHCATTGKRLTGRPVGLDEGLYLITSQSAPATALRLNILERGVDWVRQ